MNENIVMKRDGANTSLWQENETYIPANALKPEDEYDVIIVGGGITGMITALVLQESGKKCLVAEARNLGFVTTSLTTAHLNTFMDSSKEEM
jgi:NADH dehydrogenase FAD-containing subunit